MDIDIVTTSDMKRYLVTKLEKRGFHHYKDAYEDRRLCKQTASGPVQVDFFNSRTPYKFEGRRETIKYNFLLDEFERNRIGGIFVPVPSRTGLLVTKLKAAWDRDWRLENGQSADPEYEHRKIIKDLADIISIADRVSGDKALNLDSLGGLLDKYEFLTTVFERVSASADAAALYGTNRERTGKIIKELTSLL